MRYKNPIIRGFNPDPSICRVGSDYYLVTSTFEYFPGIPVYHSTDLVNWELIGHCIDRPGQLPMERIKPSGGIWAPTIRYYNGTFYVTATFSECGNFIVSSKTPGSGYSDPVWTDMDGIDPSMFFEDGKMYYCANDCGSRSGRGEGISVARVNPETGKVIGEVKRIWEGTGGGWLEAPHIYHIGDYYYILAAEGGTGQNHIATAARSHELFGEYEMCPYNPILTNRNDITKQALCCGHADLIDDNNGNWWVVHLGTRPAVGTKTNLGRETFLTPIQWENGWFRAVDGKAKIIVDAPIMAEQKAACEISTDFTNPEWEKQWLFLKEPVLACYQRTNGVLTLYPSTDKLTDEQAFPTFAAMRQPDFECEVKTEFTFEPHKIEDEAGLAVYLTPRFMYRIGKKREADGDYIIVEKTAEDFHEIAYKKKIEQEKICFMIKADKEKYRFYYSDGDTMQFACSASTHFVTCEVADKCFTGTVIGIYVQCAEETSTSATFYKFSVTPASYSD